ncbi:hypothetical protein [Nocardioides pyridinolyticus]
MSMYRVMWQTAVMSVALAAFAGGVASLGWFVMLVVPATLAVLGACGGFTWVEESPRRRAVMARAASGAGIGAVLWLGLPFLIGAWMLLAVASLAASAPPLVGRLAGCWRRSHPARTSRQLGRLPIPELEQWWRRSGRELASRRADPVVVLALVQERALLLDEIERRDPVGFHNSLVRAGWREPQDL